MTEGQENSETQEVDIHTLTKELSNLIDTSILSDPLHTVTAEYESPRNTPELPAGGMVSSTPESQLQSMGDLANLDNDMLSMQDDKVRILACFETSDESKRESVTVLRDVYKNANGKHVRPNWYSIHVLRRQNNGQGATLEIFQWYPDGSTDISENPMTLQGMRSFDTKGGNASFSYPQEIDKSSFSFHSGLKYVPDSPREAQQGARDRLTGLSSTLKALTQGKHFSPGMLDRAADAETHLAIFPPKITKPPIVDAGK